MGDATDGSTHVG